MNRYYVQSGEFSEIIHAADSNAAAMWLMHIVMETFFPDQRQIDFGSDPFEVLEDGLLLLGEEIRVSSDTFDDEKAKIFDTVETFTEWNELIIAVAKMQEKWSSKTAILKTDQADRSRSKVMLS